MGIDKTTMHIGFADKTAGSSVTHNDINEIKNKHNLLVDNCITSTDLAVSVGSSTTVPMTQDAVTKELNKKLDTSNIVQSVGGVSDQAVDKFPSQKALTTALSTKLNISTFDSYFENI